MLGVDAGHDLTEHNYIGERMIDDQMANWFFGPIVSSAPPQISVQAQVMSPCL